MHETGLARAGGMSGPAQLHRLREGVQRGDADVFARELNLDPHETARWFEEGFGAGGYGAEVVKALGLLVLQRMVLTSPRKKNDVDG